MDLVWILMAALDLQLQRIGMHGPAGKHHITAAHVREKPREPPREEQCDRDACVVADGDPNKGNVTVQIGRAVIFSLCPL